MNKIMIFVPYLYDGGAERASSIWANILSEKFEVFMLNFYKLEIEYSLNSTIKRLYLAEDKRKFKMLSNRSIIVKIRNILIDNKIDLIIPFLHKPSVYAYFSCKNTNVKVVNTIRNNPWKSPTKFYNRIFRNFVVKKSKYLITQTIEQSNYFAKFSHVSTYVIPNLINENVLKYTRNHINNLFNIICVGRLHKQKNYGMVIKVAKYLKERKINFKISIFGKGKLENKIKKIIESNGLNDCVELKGNVENIYEVESKYDLYLLTSRYEGFPNALLEAMAIGLPVISTNCKTGITDLIKNEETGFLVGINDYKEVGNLICKLSLDNNLLNTMAKNGQEYVLENFNLEKIKAKLLSVIEEIIRG